MRHWMTIPHSHLHPSWIGDRYDLPHLARLDDARERRYI